MTALPVTKTVSKQVGLEAIEEKGWLLAHKWLLLRRISQLGILALFLAGPLAGAWIVQGNIASSLTLQTLPLTDPFVFTQSLVTGYWPEATALIGALIVIGFYLLVGGRVYCSWVCPINIVTDAADWLYRKLNIKASIRFSKNNRYVLLFASFFTSAVTGVMAWELINPVTMLYREIVFGMGMSWLIVSAIFILDAFISRRSWCGRFCPMGAFYSLVSKASLLRVSAPNRKNCNDCMDCYVVCPEPQVIKPVLKGDAASSTVILSGNCTNCGRCIDVCSKDVFSLGHRFN